MPSTLFWSFSKVADASEQVMRPVRPSAKRSSAVSQRSTFGDDSFARADTTWGSASESQRTMFSAEEPMSIRAPPARS